MSAIAIYTNENFAVIATDTLNYKMVQGKIIPLRYSSKTELFPELKSCITILGYSRLTNDLRTFIQRRVLAFDVDTLVEFISLNLLGFLDMNDYSSSIESDHYNPSVIGDLRVVGYSESKKCLRYYLISIDRDNIQVEEQDMSIGGTLMHPRIEDADVKEIIFNSNNHIEDVLVAALKQMNQESLRSEESNIGVGGSIILTSVVANPDFYMLVSSPCKFDNFPGEYVGILKRRTELLLNQA